MDFTLRRDKQAGQQIVTVKKINSLLQNHEVQPYEVIIYITIQK